MDIKSIIRTIPDYPKKGIMFRDITTLWQDAGGFRQVVDQLVWPYAGVRIDKVAGIEARGFVLGGAVAHQLINLIRRAGGTVIGAAFVIDLPDIGGAKRVADMGVNVRTLCEFEGD